MDMNTKTSGTKTGAPQAFREMTERGTTQAKETYEKMSVASTEAADLIQNRPRLSVRRTTTISSSSSLTRTPMLPLILFRRCPA